MALRAAYGINILDKNVSRIMWATIWALHSGIMQRVRCTRRFAGTAPYGTRRSTSTAVGTLVQWYTWYYLPGLP